MRKEKKKSERNSDSTMNRSGLRMIWHLRAKRKLLVSVLKSVLGKSGLQHSLHLERAVLVGEVELFEDVVGLDGEGEHRDQVVEFVVDVKVFCRVVDPVGHPC